MDIFVAESQEHLDNLNKNLLLLEKNPDNKSVLNEIFRSAHTLKGMAATMGLERMAELTHEMETVLTFLKEGKIVVKQDIIDLLLSCLDDLNAMIRSFVKEGKEPCIAQGLIDALRNLSECGSDQSQEQTKSSYFEFNEYELSVLEASKESNYMSYHIKIELAEGTVMKSARAFMVFRCLEDFGQIIKCIPPVQDLEEEKFDNSFEIFLITLEDAEKITTALNSISEVKVASITEVNIERSLSSITPAVHSQKDDSEAENFIISSKALHLKTVRVDIDRLDDMMNLVGELVINKTRLEQIASGYRMSEMEEAIEQMGRLTTDLQSLVMKVRMVPIRQVFDRFPRMVRDISHSLHKDVELVIEGEQTELDRTVIDEIGEPLVHLIRNALDHGIEPPDVRAAVDKPRTALLRLAARQEGNNVIIEVEDDGEGIDINDIRKQAINKGFVDPREGELLDDKAVLNIIFEQGFSTNNTVNDISGRGIGMDVVKAKIESLNGTIDIETEKGKGTKVIINLPLTLAIIQALLVKVGEEQYAIPLHSIDETTFLIPEQIKMVQNYEVFLLRDMVLPLIRGSRLLEVPTADQKNSEEFVVVVHKGKQRLGLVVDQLVGQQEIVIKPLGNLLAGIPGIAGATILGNGQVATILDVNSLF
ncbi:MAG: chemotaxis protein CheA [Syntrophomonadaceae bacterium]|jgi:two-component system chemotaxis sensor kinase CheA|nr:chemotaxis protein CheA [Syntrophomonadaceae bacterium]